MTSSILSFLAALLLLPSGSGAGPLKTYTIDGVTLTYDSSAYTMSELDEDRIGASFKLTDNSDPRNFAYFSIDEDSTYGLALEEEHQQLLEEEAFNWVEMTIHDDSFTQRGTNSWLSFPEEYSIPGAACYFRGRWKGGKDIYGMVATSGWGELCILVRAEGASQKALDPFLKILKDVTYTDVDTYDLNDPSSAVKTVNVVRDVLFNYDCRYFTAPFISQSEDSEDETDLYITEKGDPATTYTEFRIIEYPRTLIESWTEIDLNEVLEMMTTAAFYKATDMDGFKLESENFTSLSPDGSYHGFQNSFKGKNYYEDETYEVEGVVGTTILDNFIIVMTAKSIDGSVDLSSQLINLFHIGDKYIQNWDFIPNSKKGRTRR